MNRTDLINLLASSIKAKTYLEIGVGDPRVNFNKITIPHKVSVDPNGRATFRLTSDEFFKTNPGLFDIIFIDGLHLCDQVLRDVENSLAHLAPHGIVLLHDCNPQVEAHQSPQKPPRGGPWTGTVWKAVAELRSTREDLKIFTVDIDYGIGVVYPHSGVKTIPKAEWTFPYLVEHREEVLGLISLETFLHGHLEELVKRSQSSLYPRP